MSNSQNLHRIMGSRFMHSKPGLCHLCKHRREYGEWEGYCEVFEKILSAAKTGVKKPRCDKFTPPD